MILDFFLNVIELDNKTTILGHETLKVYIT
jgi:hypothetical protein